ncbi:hypothetical protein [Aquipseudomonas alcaligenes]|uniref:Uncharacterized protein n=1 Tax=Aquipseudomonas alcaligenes TaxID=43263 RepID=A0A1N6NJR5_AQUAC|nr:hypothetical protein [Pseudomonas alcaligenes]SIP92359.1 hypothetical protein SAMN05878282_101355 [Pseudomonas alcaligenes]
MKLKWLTLPLIAILAGLAGLYSYAHTLPSLAFPLKSINALALSDGGSLTIELADAKGNEFYFGIKGELETPREMYPSFYMRTFLGIPLMVTPEIGSAEELKLAGFAKELAEKNLSPSSLEKVKNSDLDGLSKSEFSYAVIYSIYSSLSERHASN